MVESDKYTADDGVETKTFDVSGLELNKSYQHTFTFGEVFQVSVFFISLFILPWDNFKRSDIKSFTIFNLNYLISVHFFMQRKLTLVSMVLSETTSDVLKTIPTSRLIK